MWTIEQAVKHYETLASRLEDICMKPASEYPKQTAAWLRELSERRKMPEIITCGECELNLVCCRTIRSEGRNDDDFCSCGIREERRTDK